MLNMQRLKNRKGTSTPSRDPDGVNNLRGKSLIFPCPCTDNFTLNNFSFMYITKQCTYKRGFLNKMATIAV